MKLSQKQLEQLVKDSTLDHKGKNLYGVCPKCGYDEFGISLDNNHPFQCFRHKKCGFSGNIYTLLKLLGRAKEFLSEREIDVFEKLQSNLLERQLEIDLSLPEIQPPLLWKRSYDDAYVLDRGFSDYQFEKFEVGRSKLKKEYVTFLVRMNGKLVGHVTRSERKKEWIDSYNAQQKQKGSKVVYLRYCNSDTDFDKVLFGYDEIIAGVTEDVILTEGIFSKTKTDLNLGLDNYDKMKCCATLGSKFSPSQIELLRLKQIKNLWFWFEADVLNTIKDIVSKASNYFNVRVCYLDGKDPNDLNSEEAFNLLNNSKDWLDFNMSYVKCKLE